MSDPHAEIIGKYVHLVARPEDFTPPTGSPEDCICGAKGDSSAGRLLIANCPCCDGVQILREELYDVPQKVVYKAIFAPGMTIRAVKAAG